MTQKFNPVRTDSRSKVGIEWYATEAEALARVPSVIESARRQVAQGYDFGWLNVGRNSGFDTKDAEGNVVEFAVVTP